MQDTEVARHVAEWQENIQPRLDEEVTFVVIVRTRKNRQIKHSCLGAREVFFISLWNVLHDKGVGVWWHWTELRRWNTTVIVWSIQSAFMKC